MTEEDMNKEEMIIWSNGEFMPWGEAKTHPIGQGLHYGLGIFEGIRFYNTDRGPAIFRLREHLERLFASAAVLHITILHSTEELTEVIKELIRRNRMREGYIRPMFFYGGGKIGLNVRDAVVEYVIEVRPWVNEQKEFLRVKTSSYRRIDPRSTNVNAKIAGHYVNSFLARFEAGEAGFDETILLDYKGYVAEASVENIFAVKNGTLYTPKLGTILPGITRDTVILLAKDLGYEVKEKNLRVEFFKEADEVFLSGTAMGILVVGEIDGVPIGNGRPGEITRRLTQLYHNIVEGRVEKYLNWLAFVN
jgi:branched-chain amino acid aminotransferase